MKFMSRHFGWKNLDKSQNSHFNFIFSIFSKSFQTFPEDMESVWGYSLSPITYFTKDQTMYKPVSHFWMKRKIKRKFFGYSIMVKSYIFEIFGIVDNSTKELVALRIPDRKTDTLRPIIGQFSQIGSKFNTDGWVGYAYLNSAGWRHVKVCHKT